MVSVMLAALAVAIPTIWTGLLLGSAWNHRSEGLSGMGMQIALAAVGIVALAIWLTALMH